MKFAMDLVLCFNLVLLLGWVSDARPWPLKQSTTTAPLKVGCMADTPILLHRCVMVWPYTNKPADDIECRLSRHQTLNCTTPVMFTGIPPGRYRLVLTARTDNETATATYRLIIPPHYGVCTSHLINDGVTISDNHTAVVEFSGYGSFTGFNCKLDSPVKFPCQSPLVLEDLDEGEHWLRIIPNGCHEEERLTFFFTIPSSNSTTSASPEPSPPDLETTRPSNSSFS